MAPFKKYDPMALVDGERAKRQARLNKQRADRMERDVAAYLNRGRLQLARRTPQSGAGWIKGDNHVPLPTPPYFFLISCKMSQAQTKDNKAYIQFSTKWLSELERDVRAMKSIGCKFGIMVVRWFGRVKGELVALINKKDIKAIEDALEIKIEESGVVYDKSKKANGAPLKVTRLFREFAIENPNATFKIDEWDLIIMPLSVIHEALLKLDKAVNDGGL